MRRALLAAAAAAAAAADQTPRFVGLLTNLSIDAATALCEAGGVAGPRAAPLVLAAPPGAPVASAELADFLVALLPRHPAAIETLACAVAHGSIDAPARPDGGAGLLAVAAAKKHLKLAAALLKQGASLRYVAPRDAGGAGLAHAALGSRLLAVDIAAKVLKAASVRAAAAAAAPAPAGGGSGGGSGGVAAWLRGIGRALERHLAPVSPADAKRVQAAVARLTATADGGGPATVYASDLAALANGLSTLLLQLLLSAAEQAGGGGGGGGGAVAEQVSATGGVAAAAAAPPAAADCSPLARARALHAAWARAPRLALLVSADRYGRTPLHVAAAHDNTLAGVLLLRALADAVSAQGAGPLGHPLSLDGCHHRSDGDGDGDGGGGVDARRLLSTPRRAAAAVAQYLGATDSLGATALELACAHGHGGFAAALHAVAASLGVATGSGGGGGGGGDNDDASAPASVCAPVLRRLNATTAPLNGRTVGGASTAAAGSLASPSAGPWDGGRKKHEAHGAVPPAVAAAGGGWAAAGSQSALPREAAKAVRAARKRLVDRLWGPPAALAAGGKAPSINSPAAVAAFRDHCDVEVVDFAAANASSSGSGDDGGDALLTPAGFLRAFTHASRPVLLRGFAARWSLRAAWTRDALLAAGAGVPVTASRIPYEHAFVAPPPPGGAGAGGSAVRLTLAEYVRAMSECGRDAAAGGGGSSPAGATAAVDPALCAQLGYAQPGAGAAAAAAAAAAAPLYVFDVIAKAKSDVEARAGSSGPWALLPTPTAVSTCKVGCGRTLNAAMQREWFHDPQQGLLLQSVDFQLPLLNAFVPVDARAPGSVPRAALLQAAAEAAAASAPAARAGAAPRLGHGHAGDPELEDGVYELKEHDIAMLASPLPHPQFFVGPAGSGSPPHWHKSAWNVLAWGQKRWAILPPSASVYSATPAATWWTRELPHLGAGCAGGSPGAAASASSAAAGGGGACAAAPVPPLECTQNAGDVLFVPPAWGHAVLNTEPSVGVAIEYTTPLSR